MASVRWACAGCGEELRTPTWVVPEDRVCAACRGEEALTPAAPAPFPAEPTLDERLTAAGVPERYRAFSREGWRAMAAAPPPTRITIAGRRAGRSRSTGPGAWPAALDAWPEAGGWVLVVTGLYGRGKTGLATARFRELVDAGHRPALWLDAAAYLGRLQAGFADGSHHRLRRRATEARLLLLDDLGATQALESAWWRGEIARLLRDREAHQAPTILTTNALDVRQAMGILDPTLPSRFARALTARLDGPDRRKESV